MMSALVSYLTDSGIEVVLIGQPVLWKKGMTAEEKGTLWFYINSPEGRLCLDTEWLVNEMSRYNEVQRQIAVSSAAYYIDMNNHIPKTLDFFFDDCHFTKGSIWIPGS
jgi:hypothetical protein